MKDPRQRHDKPAIPTVVLVACAVAFLLLVVWREIG
jgi:hypothetical protein